MVLKAEMQSRETEPSAFYSSPLIEAEEDIQSGKFEAFLSITLSEGAKTFVTRVYFNEFTFCPLNILARYPPSFAAATAKTVL